MNAARVLVAGATNALRQTIDEALANAGVHVDHTASLFPASDESARADVIIGCCERTNLQEETVRWLSELKSAPRMVPAIVIAEEHDINFRLACVQAGAVDCLTRPLNLSRLKFLVDILTIRPRLTKAAERTSPIAQRKAVPVEAVDFVCGSPKMRQLMDDLRLAAKAECTILITGETGTGKTHLARVLHEQSTRKDRPFIAVNCAAMSPTLIESELFGHVRGSFTGADNQREGKLAKAGEGTLLLDEIDSLPLESQAKLLRAVEEREFYPLGSEEPRRFRARLVAAANRPFEKEVAEGRFRMDLYYRLNVVSFRAPPLRERRQDIPALLQKFLDERTAQDQSPRRELSAAASRALVNYDWPGNVRELRNLIERLTVLCSSSTIDVQHLPENILSQPLEDADCPQLCNQLAQARLDAEQRRLVESLERNHNNRSVTAAELGISRTVLYKKLKKYRLV